MLGEPTLWQRCWPGLLIAVVGLLVAAQIGGAP